MGKVMSPKSPSPPLPSVNDANEFIEHQLDDRIRAIEGYLGGDAISLNGPLLFGVDDIIRKAVEQKCQENPPRTKLVVLLTTGGGIVEVVPRIVDTFRRHYTVVDFIIPNYAFSAGTVLVMSGDAIHMDAYSRLGPIDPQILRGDGSQVPALGYLERYNKLLKKANNGHASTAEIQLLISAFDQGELYQYEHARALSVALLKEWLVKYKFKEWKITRTRKRRVTVKMKEKRAAQIAMELNNTEKWHVHGHGISMAVLENDLNVMIDDFGKDPGRSKAIRGYHELMSDYMAKRNAKAAIHFSGRYVPFM
jgi:Serine dehydrogenase proteinase